MIAYAVESGQYSDHMIHCLFSTKELAEEYVQALILASHRTDIEYRMAEPDDPPSLTTGYFEIVPYQVWDTLPVVEDKAAYQQDHTEPPA